MFKKKSILFVLPSYHYSFALRDRFRKTGWRADVFVDSSYPRKLLYQNDYIGPRPSTKRKSGLVSMIASSIERFFWFIFILLNYKYFLFYGDMGTFSISARLDKVFRRFSGPGSSTYIAILKALKKKIIYWPSGCLDREIKSNFAKFDSGNVCRNCHIDNGFCNDSRLKARFAIHRRYGDLFLGGGNFDSTQLPETHVRFMGLNLDEFQPDIYLSRKLRLPPTKNVRIMHSFFDEGRKKGSKNIKGSPSVYEAVEKLRVEGYPVEYFYVNDMEASQIRYYQAQVDIIVDQLIFGWWGSTGVEAMGLGKPVVCYLRKEWKDFFFKIFSEYECLPIVEANTETIYEVLKKLVIDKEYRERKGKEARLFAERHFDVKKNALELEKIFLNL